MAQGAIMALCLIPPSAVVPIAKATATYRPLAITLEKAVLSDTVLVGLAPGDILTLDFFARQLLQAAVVRLRFKIGPSDMAVIAGSQGRQAGSARLVKLGLPEGVGGVQGPMRKAVRSDTTDSSAAWVAINASTRAKLL